MENIKTFFKKKNIDFFFPISFILAIVPLIVRLHVNDVDKNTLDIFGAAANTDLFSQEKALFLMFFSIILLIISIVFFKKIFTKKDKILNSILIAGAVFWIFTLLSSLFSSYKNISFFGIYDRAEGFITITCYMLLFVYSIYTFKNTLDYKYVITPIMILVSINAFLGLFQYIGQDLIKSKLGNLIVLPSDYQGSQLNLLYEKGKLYGTLFHYNYVGSFVAIVLPILFCLTLFEYEDILHKITLALGSLLSIWLLFGSTSRAGIIGILASTIFAIIIFWKLVVEKWKPLLILFVSLLVISTGLNFATKGSIFARIPVLINDTVSVFKDTSDFNYLDHIPIRGLQYSDKAAEVVLQNNNLLKISYENNNYVFKNSNGEIINYSKSNDKNAIIYTTASDEYKAFSFRVGKLVPSSIRNDGILLMLNGQPTFMFNLKQDNSIHLINLNSKKDIDLVFPETFGFNGKEQLASSRFYIWSRAIPLLKDNLILGSGPDTFVFRFPQNDLLGLYYSYGNSNTIVDKPHNLFLQIALNEGIIALLAFLAIMIIYIVDSVKLYAFKKYFEKPQILGAATCLGVIAYLFAGFFNDSVISVAPIFWIVLGVGVALNYMNRTQENKKNKLQK